MTIAPPYEVQRWWDEALQRGATHIIIVRNPSYSRYDPFYVLPTEHIGNVIADLKAKYGSNVSECVDLSKDRHLQITPTHRVWNDAPARLNTFQQNLMHQQRAREARIRVMLASQETSTI